MQRLVLAYFLRWERQQGLASFFILQITISGTFLSISLDSKTHLARVREISIMVLIRSSKTTLNIGRGWHVYRNLHVKFTHIVDRPSAIASPLKGFVEL